MRITQLQENKDNPDKLYKLIDTMMTTVAKTHSLTGQQMHDMWVAKYKEVPDTYSQYINIKKII